MIPWSWLSVAVVIVLLPFTYGAWRRREYWWAAWFSICLIGNTVCAVGALYEKPKPKLQMTVETTVMPEPVAMANCPHCGKETRTWGNDAKCIHCGEVNEPMKRVLERIRKEQP